MPTLPWKEFIKPQPGTEYLALLTHLPLKSSKTLPKFAVSTQRIRRQLAHTGGLVGYALEAHPISGEFWTLSAWTDQDSLTQFMLKAPHQDIMNALAPHMDQTAFIKWQIDGAFVPLGWEDAKSRMPTDTADHEPSS